MRISAIYNNWIYIKEGKIFKKVNPITEEVQLVSIAEIEDLIFEGNLFYNQEINSIGDAIEYFWLHQGVADKAIA